MSADNLISVMPNPANDYVNIKAAEIIKTIQLFSATGQLLKAVKLSSNNYTLDIKMLTAGQYTLRVETASGQVNQKIIKE